MKHVIPQSGSVYADKGYYDKSAKAATAKKSSPVCNEKNNMKDKGLDKWY